MNKILLKLFGKHFEAILILFAIGLLIVIGFIGLDLIGLIKII